MPTPEEIATEQRSARLAAERAGAGRLLNAYQTAWEGIRSQLDILQSKIADAEEAGETVNRSWLYRQDRLETLLRQATNELNRFASLAGAEITEQQRAAVEAARRDAAELLGAVAKEARIGSNFNRLPTGAVEQLVGHMGDGTPLAKRLAKLPETGAAAIRQALVQGVALGRGPRDIARRVRDASAVPLSEALTISRTETLRAYRESTREIYHANSDVVSGWRWLAAMQSRTCAVCLAMHGSIHPTEVVMGTHPNCRCTMIPVLIGEEHEPFETGEEWLEKQPVATQEAVLGKKAVLAWRAKEVRLADFVHAREDEQWGLTRSVRGLADALNAAKKRGPRDLDMSTMGGGAGSGGRAPDIRPPGRPLPVNTPIGAAPSTLATITGAQRATIPLRNGLAAIDATHGMGSAPVAARVGMKMVPSGIGDGEYIDGAAPQIEVRAGAPEAVLTAVHEFGHFLARRVIGQGGGIDAAMAGDPVLAGWRQAVESSQAVRDIRAMIAAAQAPGGTPLTVAEQLTADYLTRPSELWTRSYAQYVAVRTNDPAMVVQVQKRHDDAHAQGSYSAFWDGADFEPIATAMDVLFRSLGWIQ